jgi:hypothetical protein
LLGRKVWTITTTQPCKRKNLTWPTKTGLWRLARSRRTSFEIVARSIEEVSQSQKEASLRQAPMSTSLKLNEERCSINSLTNDSANQNFFNVAVYAFGVSQEPSQCCVAPRR